MRGKIGAFIVYVTILAVLGAAAHAIVYEADNMYVGSIAQNGAFTKTSTPLTNVNVIGYLCADEQCDSVNGALWGGQTLSTGASNSIVLQYPEILQSQYGYILYAYKDGYIPWSFQADWAGCGDVGPYSNYPSKKEQCHAPVTDLSVTNDAEPNKPLQIKVKANLDATTYSAFHCAGVFIPDTLQKYANAATHVTLEIIRVQESGTTLVYTETRDISIHCSDSAELDFSWTPKVAGTYRVVVRTNVVDDKCSSSMEEYASKQFQVLVKGPQNMCYTLMNNLAISDPFPFIGEQIEVSGTKISNYADEYGNLYPTKTDMHYKIFRKSDNQLVFQKNTTLAANPDNYNPVKWTFNWDTINYLKGFYEIRVHGIANDPRCVGITNNQENVNLTAYLDGAIPKQPNLDGIPDKTTALGSGAKSQWINLWDYTTDPDTPLADLHYYLISETNSDVIHCSIASGHFVSCDAPLSAGQSDIVVEVTDGAGSDRDNFFVTVTECTSGDKKVQQCGTDVGVCEFGTQEKVCNSNGQWGNWGTCMGGVGPSTEVCDGKDNDCDGKTDEDGVCNECTPGAKGEKKCGTDVGVCEFGKQTRVCDSYGHWGDFGMCIGGVGPSMEVCDGMDNDCDGLIDEDGVCNVCTPGQNETKQCGTDVGVCEFAHQKRTCNSYGQWGNWGACTGGVNPSTEICDGKDNDCDGLIDEDGVCNVCTPGVKETKQCGTDIGVCEFGTQTRTCSANGQWSIWGTCTGGVKPSTEICDGRDNDCDGMIDEDGVCNVCTPGKNETRQCGTDVGVCEFGKQMRTCNSYGQWGDWGACKGGINPLLEICDGKDNNCNGQIDEGGVCNVCTPGQMEHKPCGTDVGVCEFGDKMRTCGSDGQWGLFGECMGGVNPVTEICDGKDNDCDGKTDEDGVCNVCQPGSIEEQACGSDVGVCEFGFRQRHCTSDGQWSVFGQCTGGITPKSEICDSKDNDCDGETDEGGVCGNIYVKVIYPNGGEVLSKTVDLKWTATTTNVCQNPIDISLAYSSDRGYTWFTIADHEANDGSYAWDTTKLPDLATFLVKVTGTDCKTSAYDISDGYFTINNHPVKEPEQHRNDFDLFVPEIVFINPRGDMPQAGDEVYVRITVENDRDDLKDVQIKTLVPDLGELDATGPFDLHSGDSETRVMQFYVSPDTPKGMYPVRFTIQNNDVKRVIYRDIVVI
jgi:hypothetical protein